MPFPDDIPTRRLLREVESERILKEMAHNHSIKYQIYILLCMSNHEYEMSISTQYPDSCGSDHERRVSWLAAGEKKRFHIFDKLRYLEYEHYQMEDDERELYWNLQQL